MPKKTSVKGVAGTFKKAADSIVAFINACSSCQRQTHVSWLHDYAIIRLYREFEILVLEALIGSVNNDTTTLSQKTGIAFPKHLTHPVCRYLIVGEGYFDFKGRAGLIKVMKQYLPPGHYLLNIVTKPEYEGALDKLSALRNFAAHGSWQSKNSALKATGQERLASSGSWLMGQGRFRAISDKLKELATEVESLAPY